MIPHSFQGQQINQLEKDTVIAGRLIPKGYVNATQMCKANKKRWVKYLEFSKTKPFLEALKSIQDNRSPSQGLTSEVSPREGLTHVIIIDTGSNETRGTWVSFQVAMNLAQWLSPTFAAWAAITLAAVIQGDYKALTAEAEEAQAQLQKLLGEIRAAGKLTRRTLTDAIKDWYERNPGGTTCPQGAMISRVTNAVYELLWGMDAIQIEDLLDCDRHKLRDSLSAQCLQDLDRAEANVIDWIDLDNMKPIEAVTEARIRRSRNRLA